MNLSSAGGMLFAIADDDPTIGIAALVRAALKDHEAGGCRFRPDAEEWILKGADPALCGHQAVVSIVERFEEAEVYCAEAA